MTDEFPKFVSPMRDEIGAALADFINAEAEA